MAIQAGIRFIFGNRREISYYRVGVTNHNAGVREWKAGSVQMPRERAEVVYSQAAGQNAAPCDPVAGAHNGIESWRQAYAVQARADQPSGGL